jgi:hypothetical protein
MFEVSIFIFSSYEEVNKSKSFAGFAIRECLDATSTHHELLWSLEIQPQLFFKRSTGLQQRQQQSGYSNSQG